MSFFAWIDHDPKQNEAIRSLLASFQRPEARDELGLGGFRDTFADLFFPGTSTIQTRLRYMLFVPWCCQRAARITRGDEAELAKALRTAEGALIGRLRHLGRSHGVIGFSKGADLQNMPSTAYWSGLRAWGIYRSPGSVGEWPGMVVRERYSQCRALKHEDDSAADGQGLFLWDTSPPMPAAPEGFLEKDTDFKLTGDERDYLLTRFDAAAVRATDGSLRGQHNLLGVFARHRLPKTCDFFWDHPACANLPSSTCDLIKAARTFSVAMYGAVLLYNLLIARKLKADGKPEESDRLTSQFEDQLTAWEEEVAELDLVWLALHLTDMAAQARSLGHGIKPQAVSFIEAWLKIVSSGKPVAGHAGAAQLVAARERDLKGAAGTARLQNKRAREHWGGWSGGRLIYRWDTAHQYLRDIADV